MIKQTLIATAIGMLAAPILASAAPAAIDFDDLGSGVVVGSTYAGLGVTFSNAVTNNLGTLPGASPPTSINSQSSGFQPQPTDPIVATFATPASSVSLTGIDIGLNGFVLTAYDAAVGGNIVDTAQVFGSDVGVGEFYTLTVTGPGNILRVEFSQVQNVTGDGAVWDNLVVDGAVITGDLVFNPKGVGHIQYIPYFSTQEGNVTAISIVNTDTKNGKVLKVRFRGASNSDDLYDFQVFLSPGDVWTAGISQAGDGRSQLATADKSCTLPANVNGAFVTSRISPAGGVAETREGYIEILTMADIVMGAADSDQRALYTATKHVKGVAPCTSSVLSALTHENASDYMAPPTTGITANWSIINVNRIVAYSGEATAIEARDALGDPGQGRLVYWDQRPTSLSVTEANANTADPLLRGASPAIAGARYDLPDLSTPYLPDLPLCPFCQARALSDAITTTQIASEFYNEASLGAQTDLVISFPTRRYFAAVKYGTTNTIVRNATSDGNIYFTADNTEAGSAANGGKAWQICAKLGANSVAFWDREETPTVIDDIVISPGTPTQLSICGEVAVVGVNNASASNSATFGSVARSNVNNGFTEGWGSLTVPVNPTTSNNDGLPMLARQFLRINNTTTNVYYGMSFPAKIVLPGLPAPYVPPAPAPAPAAAPRAP